MFLTVFSHFQGVHVFDRSSISTATTARRPHLLRSVTAGLAAALAVPALVLAAPANAETGTVKVKTQKMTDSTLKSTQKGWYSVGDKLNLVCHKRGQSVQGYFSRYLPNGGWDNLWYRTADGHYVADVDIETGTQNALGPECSALDNPAPTSNAAPAPTAGGSLRLPLNNVAQGRGFGGSGHNGIDYPTPVGTPVYAAADGTVTFAGDGRNNSWMGWQAGNCILLKHSDKYTGYAHLNNGGIKVSNGQAVKKGQLIGYTGSTGNSTGPHLHFEVLPLRPDFKNGYAGRVDPAKYFG